MIILLDNGHGVDTKGKRSPKWKDGTQLFEWEFNRDIVKRISERLKALNLTHCVLVPEDKDISLSERCRRANQYDPGRSLLISVHANAGKGTGFEVWTSVGTTKSDFYATKWVEQISKDFPDIKMRTDFSDKDADKESDFYILKNTKCPAILTENLFMDNEKDCRLMMDNSFRDKLADSYVRFIQKLI